MAEVKILVEGYTNEDSKAKNDEEATACTISLVKDNDIVMIVDPGVLKDQQILVDALKKEGLGIEDITHVCLTHSHIDHFRNIGMFPKAKTLEYYGLWEGDTVDDWKEQFSEDIKIIKTPGHNSTGISLLVNTDKGKVAIIGDVFWKENEPKDDPYADDKVKLEESRKKILEIADYIVPGHSGMFKVNKI